MSALLLRVRVVRNYFKSIADGGLPVYNTLVNAEKFKELNAIEHAFEDMGTYGVTHTLRWPYAVIQQCHYGMTNGSPPKLAAYREMANALSDFLEG